MTNIQEGVTDSSEPVKKFGTWGDVECWVKFQWYKLLNEFLFFFHIRIIFLIFSVNIDASLSGKILRNNFINFSFFLISLVWFEHENSKLNLEHFLNENRNNCFINSNEWCINIHINVVHVSVEWRYLQYNANSLLILCLITGVHTYDHEKGHRYSEGTVRLNLWCGYRSWISGQINITIWWFEVISYGLKDFFVVEKGLA